MGFTSMFHFRFNHIAKMFHVEQRESFFLEKLLGKKTHVERRGIGASGRILLQKSGVVFHVEYQTSDGWVRRLGIVPSGCFTDGIFSSS